MCVFCVLTYSTYAITCSRQSTITHTKVFNYWVLDIETIGKKSWSKEDIATCSSVFFLSLDILNSSSTFIFCFQIQEKMILYVLYHGIWTHEGQVWGPQMLVRHWAVTRKWFLWHCCCCLPSNGRKPTTDLSLYILYVLYVCIIKWLQSPGRMQKNPTRELGEEKKSPLLCIYLGLFGCEKVLIDSCGTSCTYQT